MEVEEPLIPFVSVIMLSYNHERFIREAIESVLNQKHPYPYEFIIADDMSHDGSRAIISEYAARFPDVIRPIFNERNKGIVKNYFDSVSLARGTYIFGIASDDAWLPGKVVLQVEFLEKNPSFSLCYSPYIAIDEDGTLLGQRNNHLCYYRQMMGVNYIMPVTMCVRAWFLRKYYEEIHPEEREWPMEDYPFLLYASYESDIFCMKEPTAYYRIVNGSACHHTDVFKAYRYYTGEYNLRLFFAARYGEQIERMTPTQILRCSCRRMGQKNPFVYLKTAARLGVNPFCKGDVVRVVKKAIKFILPYGVVRIVQWIKHCLHASTGA